MKVHVHNCLHKREEGSGAKILLGQFRETAEVNDVDTIGGDLNMSAHRERGTSRPSSIEEAWETTHLIPPRDLVPMWDAGLGRLLSDSCLRQVRIQLVVTQNILIECKFCQIQTWTAGLRRPPGAWESEGPHPHARTQMCALEKPDTQGPPNTKRDLTLEHPRRSRRRRSRKSALHHSWSHKLAACGRPNGATGANNSGFIAVAQCEESSDATTSEECPQNAPNVPRSRKHVLGTRTMAS